MNASDILAAVNAGEDKDWEFKSARGGMPGSLWETYSAMANTDGGVIVLGIRENDGDFEVQGLDDPVKIEKDFWTTIHNRGKVNANLLANSNVRIVPVDGKLVLFVEVPRASRRQRPIFVGQNPLEGTYRRYSDGDYLCSRDEVGRMLADQSEQSADSRILLKFTPHDLDDESLRQYRNRFSARNPNHAWLTEDTTGFLRKLGGWNVNRETGEEGLTVAGLLMFGNEDALNDPSIGLKFHLDYRERVSNSIADRWVDRLTIDGTWMPNLFQFFQRVYPKLIIGLKLPFAYQTLNSPSLFTDPLRSGMSPTHEAIQEALVNALIHADYRGLGGVVIDRYPDRLELSNPGTLLVSLEQLRHSVTECRNPLLQRMFQMMGACDKAGSGIDKIRQGWASQKWRWPIIEEQLKPDRVRLTLPMVSLLPEDSLARLRLVLGDNMGGLDGHEVQALVTADVEGSVSNHRLQQFSSEHTTDITRMLQDLVAKGFLIKDNYGRWASYRLAEQFMNSRHGESTPDTDSGHGEATPDTNSGHGEITENQQQLLKIAEPARKKRQLNPEIMRAIIRELCDGRYLTVKQLAELLSRESNGLQRWTLRPMAQDGQLVMQYPDNPNHPKQSYRTNPAWSAE
ncbi:putative DNA binding domain-containing protein [Telmatocola sphagniphila]|uniref:Putative DNA binding domain-containing protein n=1 Tax=Telmatocola sphagniphila TaxID=1123043 RepID=A0A8E6B3K5_9BACT|nr:ATP-binding protein [Telmatocola sphagniphila]QVL31227.1 putative DNA binding domain-containing protein [Telmatocola sphagniphila]